MKSIVQKLREEKNFTQNELAEKSRLSLRTIQRIEAGNTLKGFTLKAIAIALETEPQNLIQNEEIIKTERAKLINLSTLAGVIIPFGGIILSSILTYKTSELKNKELGKNMVSIQIILATTLSILLIISPFIQRKLSLTFPLFIIPLVVFIALKLFIIIMNGISLNKKNNLYIKLKINFL